MNTRDIFHQGSLKSRDRPRIPNKKISPRSVGSNLLLREQLGLANLGRDIPGDSLYIYMYIINRYIKQKQQNYGINYGSFVVQVYGKARMGF